MNKGVVCFWILAGATHAVPVLPWVFLLLGVYFWGIEAVDKKPLHHGNPDPNTRYFCPECHLLKEQCGCHPYKKSVP